MQLRHARAIVKRNAEAARLVAEADEITKEPVIEEPVENPIEKSIEGQEPTKDSE